MKFAAHEKKILIVDDSLSMRNLLAGILREGGFINVIDAPGGKEAIEMCEREKPDLVLLDIIMPEVNGIDVLRAIAGKTKVIIVSAVGQDGIIAEAKKLGIAGYLIKPLQSGDVIALVKHALK